MRNICLLIVAILSLPACMTVHHVHYDDPYYSTPSKGFDQRRNERLELVRSARSKGHIDDRQMQELEDCVVKQGMPDWAFWLAVGRPDWELVSIVPRDDGSIEYRVVALAGGMQAKNAWRTSADNSPTLPGITGGSRTISSGFPQVIHRDVDVLRAVFVDGKLVTYSPIGYSSSVPSPTWDY